MSDDSWLADDVLGHLPDVDGPLQSNEGELINLGDLIFLQAKYYEDLPLKPVAREVLDWLENATTIDVYLTQPADFALRVSERAPYRTRAGRLVRRSDLLKRLRDWWQVNLTCRSDLYSKRGHGQVAILVDDAAKRFPELGQWYRESLRDETHWHGDKAPASEVMSGAAPAVDTRRVEPKDGSWPHKSGDRWSSEEIEAMRSMRLNGMNDEEIARVAGCKRQVVGSKIGSQKSERTSTAQMVRALASA